MTKDIGKSPGSSGIFHFPYRILAQEVLKSYATRNETYSYRIYSPFLVKPPSSAPTTDDVPPALWPEFQWHPNVPVKGRDLIPPIRVEYQTPKGPAIPYDGLRVDVWGPNSGNHLAPFVSSFMQWLRHLCSQPWISDVDRHSQSVLKRFFLIDAAGVAISDVRPFGQLIGSNFDFVTDQGWQNAFVFAAAGHEVPVYSNLYFDAINASASRDYRRAIMNAAMALESCRDQSFAKIHPSKEVKERGPRLEAPFDHTDFLKHVTQDTRQAFGRDFSEEHSEEWPHIRKLYVARHHVAHGKPAVFASTGGLEAVDKDSFSPMIKAVLTCMNWMATLEPRTSENPSISI